MAKSSAASSTIGFGMELEIEYSFSLFQLPYCKTQIYCEFTYKGHNRCCGGVLLSTCGYCLDENSEPVVADIRGDIRVDDEDCWHLCRVGLVRKKSEDAAEESVDRHDVVLEWPSRSGRITRSGSTIQLNEMTHLT